MTDVTKNLKEKISRKMFQVSAIACNVSSALSEANQNSLLSDLAEIQKCCVEAATAFKTMQTTYTAEQHAQQLPDVHTEHCCKLCGCKYGDDTVDDEGYVRCSVANDSKKQTYPCRDHCRF